MNDHRAWRTSSYSGGGNCVEVTTSDPAIVAVRDTKDRRGPELSVGNPAWSAFTEAIKRGEFDL